MKSLRVPVGKYCIQWAFLPTWKLCPLRALWVPVAFVPKFSLAVQSKYAFNWFWSVVICKAREPECYKGLKTYILWWFRRHRTEVPLRLLLHRNLNYVMECGVSNPFSTLERSIEEGLCQVNSPREGTPCSIGLHSSVLRFLVVGPMEK